MKTYSLNEVATSVANIPLEEQPGEITITPNAKRFTAKVGVDGVATVSENKDNSHTVKIKCMASSQINGILSAVYQLALRSPAGNAGIVPIQVRDMQGNSLFVALSAIITGWPERVYAAEIGDLEWELFVEDPERFEGGN